MALAVEEQSLAIRAMAAADEISQRRLDRIASHLRATSLMKDEQLAAEVCAAAAKVSKRPVSVSVLTHLMAGDDQFPKARGKLHAASSPEFLSERNFFYWLCQGSTSFGYPSSQNLSYFYVENCMI